MKKLVTFNMKERLKLAFDLVLLYLTMMITLFGFYTMQKEGLAGQAIAAIVVSIITVLGIYYLIKKAEEKEIEQKNKDESSDVKEENKALDSQISELVKPQNNTKQSRRKIPLYILLIFYLGLIGLVYLSGIMTANISFAYSVISLIVTAIVFVVSLLTVTDESEKREQYFADIQGKLISIEKKLDDIQNPPVPRDDTGPEEDR